MATADEHRRLTEQHRRDQAANQQSFLAEFLAAWAVLDLANLAISTPDWLKVVMRLIEVFRSDSALLSLDYSRRIRELDLPDAPFDFPDIDFDAGVGPDISFDFSEFDRRVVRRTLGRPRNRIPLSRTGEVTLHWRDRDPAVEASLRVTGPHTIKHRISQGEPPRRALRNAQAHAAGAALRHVNDGGRDAALAVVQNDRAALGWIRIARPDCCGFCAMLASRGITWGRYSKKSFEASDIKFKSDPRTDGAKTAKAHDFCRCIVAPVWREDDPRLDASKQWRDLWNSEIRGVYGGKDAIKAWRQLHERPELFYENKRKRQRPQAA